MEIIATPSRRWAFHEYIRLLELARQARRRGDHEAAERLARLAKERGR